MADLFISQQEPLGCASCCGIGSYGRKDVILSDENTAALAREMNELSVKERERVLDDIHGVAQVQEETEEFVNSCLQDMDFYLTRIQKAERRALDLALFLKPSLLDDKKFKLMFLRADQYDARKAANRIAKHFEMKLCMFGEEKLTKKITLDDLEERDIEKLNLIGCIILSHKDQVGRPIWFYDVARFDYDDGDSMLRVMWYQMGITMEDETAQLKGGCLVAYCPGDLIAMPATLPKFTQLTVRAGPVLDAMPCRVTAFQFCYNDPRMRYVMPIVGKAFGKHVRLRIRGHYGSDVEIQYSLMTFGITCHYLFRSAEDNERKKASHNNHIQSRREIELKEKQSRIEEESRSGMILHPQPYDVLVGRGRPYQEYPGNLRLVSMVESRLNRYRSTEDRFEKTCTIIEVVKVIHDSGGRFLQKAPQGYWKVASDKAAREKTSSAFRSSLEKVSAVATKHSGISSSDSFGRSSKRVRIR